MRARSEQREREALVRDSEELRVHRSREEAYGGLDHYDRADMLAAMQRAERFAQRDLEYDPEERQYRYTGKLPSLGELLCSIRFPGAWMRDASGQLWVARLAVEQTISMAVLSAQRRTFERLQRQHRTGMRERER